MSGHSDKIALSPIPNGAVCIPIRTNINRPGYVRSTAADLPSIHYSVRLTETGVAALRVGALARPELP